VTSTVCVVGAKASPWRFVHRWREVDDSERLVLPGREHEIRVALLEKGDRQAERGTHRRPGVEHEERLGQAARHDVPHDLRPGALAVDQHDRREAGEAGRLPAAQQTLGQRTARRRATDAECEQGAAGDRRVNWHRNLRQS
jgi:hypothetical protein